MTETDPENPTPYCRDHRLPIAYRVTLTDVSGEFYYCEACKREMEASIELLPIARQLGMHKSIGMIPTDRNDFPIRRKIPDYYKMAGLVK